MRDMRNLHLKLQEMCDCFLNTDPMHEFPSVHQESDTEEAALKWLALAILHGLNENAQKVTLNQEDESITLKIKYRPDSLLVPKKDVAQEIVHTVEHILHQEGQEKGNLPLALGIHESSVNLELKFKEKENKRKMSIEFPKLP